MKIKSTEYLQIDPMSEIFNKWKHIGTNFFLRELSDKINDAKNKKINELNNKGWYVTQITIKEDNSACGDPLFMLIFEVEREE